jgi:hypothetical protein
VTHDRGTELVKPSSPPRSDLADADLASRATVDIHQPPQIADDAWSGLGRRFESKVRCWRRAMGRHRNAHGEVVTMDTLVGADAGPEDRKPRRKARRPRQDGAAAGGGAVYGIGMIGALVYFLQAAESGWDRVLAFPKAILWPALLVYRLFKSLDQ